MLLMTLSYCMPLRGDEDDRHAFVDQRDRAVLHLGGGHAFGVDVADFLELQRAFQRDGIVIPAAEEQPVLALAELRGDLLDRVALLQHLLASARGSRTGRRSVSWHCAWLMNLPPADEEREHRQHDALAGERLGAGDADFRAGVQVDAARRSRGRSCSRRR